MPTYATGTIIGKAGATITQLQAITATRMKLSQVSRSSSALICACGCSCISLLRQNGVFFPGTRERVLLIVGTIDNVLAAARNVIERISQVPLPLKETEALLSLAQSSLNDCLPELIPNIQKFTPIFGIFIYFKLNSFKSTGCCRHHLIIFFLHTSSQKEIGPNESILILRCLKYVVFSDPRPFTAIFSIPAAAAGVVLGKGGEKIKAFQSQTGARLAVSAKVP